MAESVERGPAKRIAIFNHKGGIGKTTLTINIASALADKGKRVLLIDSDPQCNLTSDLFSEDVVNDLLDRSDAPEGRTMWTALKPVSEGTGPWRQVEAFETGVRNLFLVPGDIKLSNFEVALSELWLECFGRRPRGLLGTNALSALVSSIAKLLEPHYIFYDTGPNIGPLNRVILLDCNYFIVPAACDLFSVRALNTLGQTLLGWIKDWKVISDLAPDGTYMMPGDPRLLGYIPQGFRIYGQTMAKAQSFYLAQLEKHVYSDLVDVLGDLDPELRNTRLTDLRLGEVRNLGTNVMLAQQQGVPLARVRHGNADLAEQAEQSFSTIADRILERAR